MTSSQFKIKLKSMKKLSITILALYIITSLMSCNVTVYPTDASSNQENYHTIQTTLENFADTLASLTEDSIIILTGPVTSSDRSTIWSAVKNSTHNIELDLSQITGLTEIRDFHTCEKLKKVVIPISVTNINRFAFLGCTNLTQITFTQTSGWYITTNNDDYLKKTGGTPIDVTNPSTNAINIKTTYVRHLWYRTDN